MIFQEITVELFIFIFEALFRLLNSGQLQRCIALYLFRNIYFTNKYNVIHNTISMISPSAFLLRKIKQD